MTISYPLSLPAPLAGVATRASVTANPIVGVSRNPFTGRRETFEWGGIWTFEVALKTMRRADAAAWFAFLTALKGPAGSFLAALPGHAGPLGVATGTPVVDGAGQTGGTLATTGWTAGVTGILLAGTMFSLGSGASTHLYRLLQDANSDGSGDATLQIWPNLRDSPGNGDALEIAAPMGHWYLPEPFGEAMEPAGLDGDGDPDPFITLAFTANEVV